MGRLLLAVVLMGALAACSSAETGPESLASAPEGASLKDTCPQVEREVRVVVDAYSVHSQLAPLRQADIAQVALTRMEALREAGDLETQNALDVVIVATRPLTEPHPFGVELQNAKRAWLNSLTSLAARCAAVGSSAFQ
jgi:hypothetical protein